MLELVVGQSVRLTGEVAAVIEGKFPLVGVRFGWSVAYVLPETIEGGGFAAGDVVARVVDLKLRGAQAPRWRVRCLGDEGALLTPCEGARRERYEKFQDIRLALQLFPQPDETRTAEAASSS